jgi:CDP-glucose 4,6-dehydratase
MFGNYYRGRRVFLTGHTGFKGGWLSSWLARLGAEVIGYSLPATPTPNLHGLLPSATWQREVLADVLEEGRLEREMIAAQPEVVFHLAAQPLVRLSYREPIRTLAVNAMGTAQVLEAVRALQRPCVVVIVTTDKCYENREQDYAYHEGDPMGGHDPYSVSKACAELVTRAWTRSYFLPGQGISVATARAGNVIGGGDYALDRIVPDCVRALARGESIEVRNPLAVRPWQHVLESVSGYLWLGAVMARPELAPSWQAARREGEAAAFNFGPSPESIRSVRDLVEQVVVTWPGLWHAPPVEGGPHEAKLLSLSIEKAARELAWHPVWDFNSAVRATVEWYRVRSQAGAESAWVLLSEQIKLYQETAQRQAMAWAR